MVEESINYWTLIVAAIANMAIAVLWYGPLFAKHLEKISGITNEKMKVIPITSWRAMVGAFINSLLIAFVLLFFTITWAADLAGVLMTAFWIWVGFVATTQISSFLWEGKPFKLFLIHTSYSLVAYGVMAAILVLWR